MQLRELILKLRRERDKLNYVIDSLEQLQGIMVETKMLRKRPGRKSIDEKGRKEISERMKKYWATRRQDREKS